MHKRIFAVLAVAALTAGAAGPAIAEGTWYAFSGAREPSTPFDSASYMFQEPSASFGADGKGVDKAYLNGMISWEAGNSPYDLQLEDGSIVSPVIVRFLAALGFWRDCNGDGYIGAQNVPASWGNWAVYPRELFTIDEDLCPLGSPYNAINTKTGEPNGYIDEFRWIGPKASYTPSNGPGQFCPGGVCTPLAADIRRTQDRYDVTDQGAKVWADWGAPGEAHIITQGVTADSESTRDSDSTLEYVDGALQFAASGALGSAWTSKPNIGPCGADNAFLGGPTGTCGLWPVFQGYRVVNDSQSPDGEGANPQPLVNAFDTRNDADGDDNPCNDGLSTTAGGRNVGLPDTDVYVNDNILVEGSISGTASNVLIGTNNGQADGRCARAGTGVGGRSDGSEVETSHREPHEELRFIWDQRIHFLDYAGYEEFPTEALGTRGSTAPGGLPVWQGGTGYTMRPPRTGWGPVSSIHATYYADLSAEAFATSGADPAVALPGGGQDRHTYGAEHCPTIFTGGTGAVNPDTAWECDIDVWKQEREEDQRDQPLPGVAPRALVGDPFDLRDVDCLDNSVSRFYAEGVRAGIASC